MIKEIKDIIENLSQELKIIEKNQMEILELKATIT